MNKYNHFSKTSEVNNYADYSNMRVYVRGNNYEQYRFTSALIPGHVEKNGRVKNGQVYYNDLFFLLTNAPDAKNYLNWSKLLQVNQFGAPLPLINELLPEPMRPEEPKGPEEPIYADLDPLDLKVSPKPFYSEQKIKIQFLRDSLPKVATIIEGFLVNIIQLFYVYKLRRWERRVKEIEALKRRSKEFQPYRNDLYQHEKNLEKYNYNFACYNKAHAHWKRKCDDAEKMLREARTLWEYEKSDFDRSAETERQRLIELKRNHENRDRTAIEEVVKIILTVSPYPASFSRNFEVNYDVESQILIIDYQLPDFERLEIVEDSNRINLKPVEKYKRKSIVESTIPAIAIRTLYEIAVNDDVDSISSIVFNGWVNFLDKTNGAERTEFIVSIHATVAELRKLVIRKLDSIECFKALKGVAARNILEYVPVAPILMINKKDNRLIEGREIIKGLTSDDNLAAMNWNDFEHLLRELFEKEFSQHGAEVRITQASRDRGVDAIIYDPDPIRGGKFIVQAKRYTKLVDVSAVRDLYGTIQNEGANRGILVTTTHYGPDAYEFAKNKNITLLTGENLLHLFEKHGYKFRIDIKEARKLLNLK